MRLARLRPRLTVRRLMVAVAVVGVLLGSARWVVSMRARSAEYRRKAIELPGGHAHIGHGFVVTTKDGRRIHYREDENFWRDLAWGRKQADKYWRLSLRPWLAAGPDAPRPEPLAHPRPPAECPPELTLGDTKSCGWCARYPNTWESDPVYPWWTFPWTWPPRREFPGSPRAPRYSFP